MLPQPAVTLVESGFASGDILSGLTEEQRAILEHSGGHARVQAGPGTGKSTVLIELAGLLATPRPDGAVRLATFTRAAMNDLAHKALAEEIPSSVTTVHSMALSILVP